MKKEKQLTQRQKINNLLKVKYPSKLTTLEICERFPEIRVEVVRRNLQELLAMEPPQVRKEGTGEYSVDAYGRQHEIMVWFAAVGV